MSIENANKIKNLQTHQPPTALLLSSWLVRQGYSLQLQQKYRKSGWLVSIGRGVMIRHNDKLTLAGALYALQNQLELSVHIGGKSALAELGRAHYLQLNPVSTTLFGHHKEYLPKWFEGMSFETKPQYHRTKFLPKDLGINVVTKGPLEIKVSGVARAALECLYLASDKDDYYECMELMEGMTGLRPQLVQQLLECCNSVKVKRLFLYFSEHFEHAWFKHLDISNVDLGKGTRSLVKNGVYISKYKMTVPKNIRFTNHDS